MAQLLADRVRVSDLRGAASPAAGSTVLEDPTGWRRRRLRFSARIVAVALTLWLVALVLGGVGLSPVPGVPFAHILKPAAPPTPRHLPKPAHPTVSDLEPALPADSPKTAVAPQPVGVAGQQHTTPQLSAKRAPARSKRRSNAVHTMSPAVDGAPSTTVPAPTATHPNNGKRVGATTTTTSATTTPTTTTTTPGHSGTAPGRTGTAPGRTKTTTTTP
jgi:hypothetical protein